MRLIDPLGCVAERIFLFVFVIVRIEHLAVLDVIQLVLESGQLVSAVHFRIDDDVRIKVVIVIADSMHRCRQILHSHQGTGAADPCLNAHLMYHAPSKCGRPSGS